MVSESEARGALARALHDESETGLAFDWRTTLTPYPAPFLTRHAIWAVENFAHHHPIFLFFAQAEGGEARILTGDPVAFVRVAQDDGVRIAAPEEAVAYASAYLWTTRDTDVLFSILTSVDDLRTVPNPTAEEGRQIEDLRSRYGDVVTPPFAGAVDDLFIVTLFASRNQALERHALTVSRGGDVSDDVETLERDLPLVST
jgi:hypothetical protein